MQTKVVVTLQEISCRNVGDLFGGTNPYIWPMLIWIVNEVDSTSPPPDAFRENLGWGMKRGQTAAIPADVEVLSATIDGDLRAMLLVVPLLERSNSSDDMIRAAFDAYRTELPQAVSDNLAKLADPATRGDAISAIKQQVKQKALDAAAGKVGLLGDIAHLFGNDADDSFLDFAATQLDLESQPIFLGFAGTQLLSYTDDASPGNVSDPTTVSHDAWGWFTSVFGSTDRVYAVDPNGQLLSFADDGTPNNVPDPVVVGFGGWSDFTFLFASGTRIYAVDHQGQLLSYGDDGTPGNVSDPVIVGFGGWSQFTKVFGGGNRIYALEETDTPSIAYRIQGDLRRLRSRPPEGIVGGPVGPLLDH